jgi:hypothetical protein
LNRKEKKRGKERERERGREGERERGREGEREREERVKSLDAASGSDVSICVPISLCSKIRASSVSSCV